MRSGMWAMVMVSVLAMVGCSKHRADGTYRGEVVENDKTHELELVLSGEEGSLKLLSAGGPDANQGDSWQLRDVKIDGDRLTFVVPMSGQDEDDDDLLFDLRIEGDRLVGTGRERRKQAQDLPVTFRKQ